MRIVWFVGNGFNYMLANIVKLYSQEKSKSRLISDIERVHDELVNLNNLWGELDNILTSPSLAFPSSNGEEILQYFQTVFESPLFKNMLSRDYNIEYSENSHRNLLQDEIKRISYHFTEFENTEGYRDIYKLFPSLGSSLNEIIKSNRIQDLHVFTTNYDGILDSLLTYYDTNLRKRQFLLKDGFYFDNFIADRYRRAQFSIAHIHGSHKFCKRNNQTIKLERGLINNNPMMVYDSPSLKESIILENEVLSVYFSELADKLTNCDRIIVLGNSFKTEPHIKKLISKHFNRSNTELIICSDKPDEVASVLEPYYSFPIYTQSTTHVKSEQDLINLFGKLFDIRSYRMLASA
jgi:NAD-dependent SIR2 family protein deacetylase